jgi:oligo-1,6-glucosidase
MRNTQWYKEMAFYQIWPRSFMDGDGDGIGDLYGIFEKLDYIKDLGVDGIWFSPLYVSPNADYGYDIADYMQISPEYGDLEIFKKVLNSAHDRGLKVIMDLVVNHTSDEHEWFKAGIADRNSRYHDYYIWREGKPGGKFPNNWDSLFEGKAWEYNNELDEYYLHIFAKKQPDLNHDNPFVREEVKKIMRFWLDLGIDGFREDVITFISKVPGLPDGNIFAPAARGFTRYSGGPRIHEFLGEFKRDVLDHYDCMTVGEAPMMKPDVALSYIAEEGAKDLDLMFHFQHMEADCLFIDYIPRAFSLRKLKRAFSRWQNEINGRGWNTLYLENHDHPRVISRYGSEKYRTESGKMLAASFLFQQGTPFIYQGQEIGMTNISLDTIDDYKDVMTKNEYAKKKRWPEEKKMALIRRATRESSRTPMQWNAEKNAGFTSGEPWFTVNPNYMEVNVEKENVDENSLLNFYRKALKLRKETPVILWGSYKEHYPRSNVFYTYEREYQGARLLVICSFSEEEKRFKAPAGFDLSKGKLALSNYGLSGQSRSQSQDQDQSQGQNPVENNSFTARPYETRVYLFDYPAIQPPSTTMTSPLI